MGKSRKRTKRGDQYQAMAAGYRILRSPLADSYGAAAEHYHESDPPIEQTAGTSGRGGETSQPQSGRD